MHQSWVIVILDSLVKFVFVKLIFLHVRRIMCVFSIQILLHIQIKKTSKSLFDVDCR